MTSRYTADKIKEETKDYIEFQVVVNAPVDFEHKVYDFSSVDTLLKGAETIALQDCPCRLSTGDCEYLLDVCILLDERAEKLLAKGDRNSRQVSYMEAREALVRANQAGLVLTSILRTGDEAPKTICNCCPCCCHTLQGLIHHGLASKILTSDKVVEYDSKKCVNCHACVDRCYFGALSLRDSSLV